MDQESGIWSDWINVPTYAQVRSQDQNNNHVYKSTLYTGISIPGGKSVGGSSSGSGSSSGGSSSALGNISKAGGTTKMTVTGTMNAPVIHVRVPTSTGFVANPYKLKVKVNGKTDPVDSSIIGTPFEFISESNVALDVYVSATNTRYGNVKLLKTAPSSTDKSNSMFIYLKGTEGSVPVEALSTDGAGQYGIVVMTDTVKETYMLTIESASDGAGGIIDGGTTANFNIFGTVNDKAKTAWTKSDKVDINMVFKFEIAQ